MNDNLLSLINENFMKQAEANISNIHISLKQKCNIGAETNDISRMLSVLPFAGLFTSKKNIGLGLNSQNVIEFKNNQFNYVANLYGISLTTDDETVLLFLNELAIKNKNKTFTTNLLNIVIGSFFVNCGNNFIRAKNSLDALSIAVIDVYFSVLIKNKKTSKGFKGHIIESYQYENIELKSGYITITLGEKYYQSLTDKENPIRLLNRRSRAKCKSSDQKNAYTILATWKYQKLGIDNLMNIIKTKQRRVDFLKRCLNPILGIASKDRKQELYLDKDHKNIIFLQTIPEKSTSETHLKHERNAQNPRVFCTKP